MSVAGLKPGERELLFPVAPRWGCPTRIPLRPASRTFIAKLAPPLEETPGGVLLPNTGNGFTTNMGPAGILRSDAVQVIAAGCEIPFGAGHIVMLAPYSGERYQHIDGVDDVVFVGTKDDPWGETTPLILDGDRWEPLLNWLVIDVDRKAAEVEVVHLEWLYTGTIIAAGPDAGVRAGQRVAFDNDVAVARPDDTKWFGVRGHPEWDETHTVLVREVDAFGVRRIHAVIEE